MWTEASTWGTLDRPRQPASRGLTETLTRYLVQVTPMIPCYFMKSGRSYKLCPQIYLLWTPSPKIARCLSRGGASGAEDDGKFSWLMSHSGSTELDRVQHGSFFLGSRGRQKEAITAKESKCGLTRRIYLHKHVQELISAWQ